MTRSLPAQNDQTTRPTSCWYTIGRIVNDAWWEKGHANMWTQWLWQTLKTTQYSIVVSKKKRSSLFLFVGFVSKKSKNSGLTRARYGRMRNRMINEEQQQKGEKGILILLCVTYEGRIWSSFPIDSVRLVNSIYSKKLQLPLYCTEGVQY